MSTWVTVRVGNLEHRVTSKILYVGQAEDQALSAARRALNTEWSQKMHSIETRGAGWIGETTSKWWHFSENEGFSIEVHEVKP